MKTTPQTDSNLLVDTDRCRVARRVAVTDFQYHQSNDAIAAKSSAATTKKVLPQLKNFRSLSREVFGPAAGREYIFEAVLFVWTMVVAAWPLGVTLNQLGTMYISPPNALW